MGMTIIEKILTKAGGVKVRPGDLATVKVDISCLFDLPKLLRYLWPILELEFVSNALCDVNYC